MVEQHIDGLGRFLDVNQPAVMRDKTLTNDQAYAAIIAGLLVDGKGAKLDAVASEALTDEYLDAFEDLPAWAIREAIFKWNRGESPVLDPRQPHNFVWRPAPPILRKLAYLELWPIKSRIRDLQKVIAARPAPTEQQLADGRAAIIGLNMAMGDPEAMKALTWNAAVNAGYVEREQNARVINPPLLKPMDSTAPAKQAAE